MIKLMRLQFKLFGLFIILSSMVGCVAVQPFPYAVRAGDTITLAIGSLDDVDKNEITITYFPDPGSLPSDVPVDVTAGLRSVFNLHPDKRSKAFWDIRSGLNYDGTHTMVSVENNSGHSAWQTVLAVDLPIDLPVGTGHFIIAMGESVTYPRFVTQVGDVEINAQILEAGGNSHDFEYKTDTLNNSNNTVTGDLTNLEQLRQVIVRSPAGIQDDNIIAAAEYNLLVPVFDETLNDVSDLVLDTDLAVILDDQINYERNQTALSWSRSGQNIKVIVVSPTGNQNANLLRFSILFEKYLTAEFNGWSLSDSASLASVKYFDVDGNEVFGLIPEVVVR